MGVPFNDYQAFRLAPAAPVLARRVTGVRQVLKTKNLTAGRYDHRYHCREFLYCERGKIEGEQMAASPGSCESGRSGGEESPSSTGQGGP
jgi:hypothetical protein